MNKSMRLKLKLMAILIGIFSIVIVSILTIIGHSIGKKQEANDFISFLEVQNLIGACNEEFIYTDLFDGNQINSMETKNYFTYKQYLQLLNDLQKASEQLVEKGVKSQTFLNEKEINDYSKKYSEEFYLEKKDWYTTFESIDSYFDLDNLISKSEIFILALGSNISDTNGEKLDDTMVFADSGLFCDATNYLDKYLYKQVEVYSKASVILSVSNIINNEYSLQNVWINEVQKDYIVCFWDNKFITIPFQEEKVEYVEQIGDLIFKDGMPSEIHIKTEKVHGKLMQIKDGMVEIEGLGTYPVADSFKIYKLYGTMERYYTSDLRIGYDFTDYVISDGEISACLVTRDEAMENIRVLIKNSDYQGYFHNEIRFISDSGGTIKSGTDEWKYSAGEEHVILQGDDFFTENRINIVPDSLTSTITLLSVNRAQGNPSYKGTMEVEKTEEGLVVVNEILLEDYLYSVVPSEMPSYYPREALEAQSVCARTYAYSKMVNAGLAKFGAHLDDSSSYQVYNNIVKTPETTQAVKETKGQILYCNDQLVEAYYYSTSCGVSGDASIWKSDTASQLTYLVSKRIGDEALLTMASSGSTELNNSELLINEDNFQSFITTTYPSDYESKEGWYRWKYQVESINTQKIVEKLNARFQVNNNYILTKNSNDVYESLEPKELGTILNIYISKRMIGGVADELIIEGSLATYKIISEYNIRYILCDQTAKILRQDGSEVEANTLIPSAFCMVTPEYLGDEVTGYLVVGGGFGHGVGLSQNGAKCMAELNQTSEEILIFFYEGSVIKNVY